MIKFSTRYDLRKYKQYISEKCLDGQAWLALPSLLMSLYQWKFATDRLDLCTTSSPANKQQIPSTTICKPTKYSSAMLTCKIHSQGSLARPQQYSCCLGGHKLAGALPDSTLNFGVMWRHGFCLNLPTVGGNASKQPVGKIAR